MQCSWCKCKYFLRLLVVWKYLRYMGCNASSKCEVRLWYHKNDRIRSKAYKRRIAWLHLQVWVSERFSIWLCEFWYSDDLQNARKSAMQSSQECLQRKHKIRNSKNLLHFYYKSDRRFAQCIWDLSTYDNNGNTISVKWSK